MTPNAAASIAGTNPIVRIAATWTPDEKLKLVASVGSSDSSSLATWNSSVATTAAPRSASGPSGSAAAA
jgi:hypothetical protein